MFVKKRENNKRGEGSVANPLLVLSIRAQLLQLEGAGHLLQSRWIFMAREEVVRLLIGVDVLIGGLQDDLQVRIVGHLFGLCAICVDAKDPRVLRSMVIKVWGMRIEQFARCITDEWS